MFIVKTPDNQYLELRESGKAGWSPAPRQCVTFVTEGSFNSFMRDNFPTTRGIFQCVEDGKIIATLTLK